ncbi:hypothetical protein LGH82_21630 [Mesorhizobium sp. PAMC28654]|uniref:hypothetical protein n=1 Tax=Mesorhizobium sp. PAMC28654 TaxID=2880934 RepID=UPI001D0AF7C8|nr:hypothetical protein [Mesorhizobium sp. PAMC28654]UDL87761.1 hypothetical protein LGH82_21630 [Mesorhizobium sp. PAMC28654]
MTEQSQETKGGLGIQSGRDTIIGISPDQMMEIMTRVIRDVIVYQNEAKTIADQRFGLLPVSWTPR